MLSYPNELYKVFLKWLTGESNYSNTKFVSKTAKYSKTQNFNTVLRDKPYKHMNQHVIYR